MLIEMNRNAKPIFGGIVLVAMLGMVAASFGSALTSISPAPDASSSASASPSPTATGPGPTEQGIAAIVAQAAQLSLAQPHILQSCLAPKTDTSPEAGSDVYAITDPETGGMWYADHADGKTTIKAGYPTGKGAWMSLGSDDAWVGAIQTAKVTDLNAPTAKERKAILAEAGAPDATWVAFPEDGSVLYGSRPTAEYGYLMRGMQILSGAYQGLVGAPDPVPTPAPGQPAPTPTPKPLSAGAMDTAPDGTRTITITPPEGQATVMEVGTDGLVSTVAIKDGQKCTFTYQQGDPQGLMTPPKGPSVAWSALEPAITTWAEKVRKAGGNASPVAQTTVTIPPADPSAQATASPQPAEATTEPTSGPAEAPAATPTPSPAAS